LENIKKLSLFFCVGDSTFLSFLSSSYISGRDFPPFFQLSSVPFSSSFHFFSFRCDGVAVVQLEKTQEPKEKRHDEVRE
jgi:hypothetical protein